MASHELRGKTITDVVWQDRDALLLFGDGTYLRVSPHTWREEPKRRDIIAAAVFTPGVFDELERGFQ